jgi:uncharacterized repeat protein (TIGR01451 family)
MLRDSPYTRRIGPSAVLALAAALIATLLVASPAQTAPGDLADLAVTKTDSPDPVAVDATLTYTIVVTNQGPQDATGVTVVDRLPSQSAFGSASATSGNCERKGNRVTCKVGNLSADPTKGNTATVTVQVRPDKAGTIENSASVDSVETDPVSLNDTATATTKVVAAPQASTCRGVPATLTGTAGADRLVGTGGPDVIAGLGGGDTIAALSGRDLICSGGGNDRVNGGPAADRVFGGGGADRLLGRGGPDLLAGNPGRDVLKGNAGADRLRGGRGFDRCVGGAGLDRVRSCEG